MEKGKIYAISISPERGQLKQEVAEARVIAGYGIENDGHAGDWGRQITCLNRQSVLKANRQHDLNVGPGGFAENILIDGLDFSAIAVGSRLKLGQEAVIEVTQIGKEDHPSVVTRTLGISLLPAEGLFCKALSGGVIRKGDAIEIL